MSSDSQSDIDSHQKRKERLSYLVDVYKLYHGHINAMFNYFLVMAGLIATAYVQSMNAAARIDKMVPGFVALFGAIISFIGVCIHVRSRELLDTIESKLKIEENEMFGESGGFLTAQDRPRWFLGRHRNQFRVTYYLFIIAFAVMSIYAFTR